MKQFYCLGEDFESRGGENVFIVEMQFQDSVLKAIDYQNVDYLGLSCNTHLVEFLVDVIKGLQPSNPVLITVILTR